jgi:rhamnosyltransferase
MNISKQALGIVLYNPEEDFIYNLKTYINKFKYIYINDNSDKVNNAIKDILNSANNISYVFNDKNVGIAKSLNLICENAILDNNKYILLLDQDSKIIDFDFDKIINSSILINDKVGIISLSFNNYYLEDDLYKKNIVLSSGSILNLECWIDNLGFEEKLFIDEVDHDYCLKILNNGYTILGTKQKYIEHKVGFITTHNFLKLKTIEVSIHSPLRTYYCFRNSYYIIFKYFLVNNRFVRNRISNLLKEFYFIIFVYSNKSQHLFYMILGILDFIRGNYGKFK